MASFYAELRVDGHVIPVLLCTYGVHQGTGPRGRVSTKVRYEPVRLRFQVGKWADFLRHWGFSPHKRYQVEVVFFAAAGGSAIETLHLPAAYCVYYGEEFIQGDVTFGSYVCELTLSDPDGFTMQAGGPGTFVTPAARDHGGPPVVPTTGVKPIGSLALELIKLGLTPAEAKYVKLDAHGLLDKALLHQGAKALAPVGGNYQALLAITDSGKTVEISTSNTFETQTTTKPITMNPVTYENEFDTLWEMEKKKWLAEGHTFEQFKEKNKGYSHDGMWSGHGGVTLVPDVPGGHGCAKGPNIQVILNTHYIGGSPHGVRKQMASILAHETYGHVLFKLQGKRWEHGKSMSPGPGSDYNAPLQTQINARIDEAQRNADRHVR